jgi:hypothetical protein
MRKVQSYFIKQLKKILTGLFLVDILEEFIFFYTQKNAESVNRSAMFNSIH